MLTKLWLADADILPAWARCLRLLTYLVGAALVCLMVWGGVISACTS